MLKYLLTILLLLYLFCSNTPTVYAQETPEGAHSVYLIGNIVDASAQNQYLSTLKSTIEQDDNKKSILFLGDLTNNSTPIAQQKELLDNFLHLGNESTDHFLIPGDRDWDNSGKNAMIKLDELGQIINEQADKAKLQFSDACPGPKTIELNEYTTLLLINSQWFISYSFFGRF